MELQEGNGAARGNALIRGLMGTHGLLGMLGGTKTVNERRGPKGPIGRFDIEMATLRVQQVGTTPWGNTPKCVWTAVRPRHPQTCCHIPISVAKYLFYPPRNNSDDT